MAKKEFLAADLFAGAGGTSTGLAQACAEAGVKLQLFAVNHWEVAIETHSVNHPEMHHYCEDLTSMNPRKAVTGGRLDLLVASPQCTHHSNARGGTPMVEQERASAWCVLRWATALSIDHVIIENVREFLNWGPLDDEGRPIKKHKGETFNAFIAALRSLGYRVEHRLMVAADYGSATSRLRLFIQAAKLGRPITWPGQTHFKDGVKGENRWRAAREIIDWSLPGRSIFGRKRPLSASTLARIEAGLKKFGGTAAEPFLVLMRGGGNKGAGGALSVDGPVPTLTAGGNHVGIAQPVPPFRIAITHQGGDRCHELATPFPTVTGAKRGEHALIEPVEIPPPFVVDYRGTGTADDVEAPVRTLTTIERVGVAQPVRFDILYRVFQPHEMAAAMSFPAGYKFVGNKEQVVKQIGNAVDVCNARVLCREVVERWRGLSNRKRK